MLNAILRGALLPIAWTFPLAAVTAGLYRFPIPLAGYQDGWDAVVPSLVATAIYGLLGGFPLVAIVGGAVAAILRRQTPSEKSVTRPIHIAALGIAAVGVGIMANLDYVIGPW